MDTQSNLPVRKHPRLKGYGYNSNGAYFITFCAIYKKYMLGEIVGRGILDAPSVQFTKYGKYIADAIVYMNEKSENLYIDKYVVMPNHVHLIIFVINNNGASENYSGASGMPRPTNAIIPKFISSIKRFSNKQAGLNIWQDSYYDHIIRDEADYLRIWKYMDENPAKWTEDEYYIN